VRGGLERARLRSKFTDFAERLDGEGPLGVAVSGGGDSVALLYALAEWSQRPLEVFCVDHGLNPLSAQWTQSVADHAARVGAGFTALHWQGDKPVSGVSAAARLARHALLAQAARQKGASVLCLAHTADDIAEAAAMRGQGSNLGTPQVWSPSPVWPEGRGVFLYRPFLDIRRETLRGYLREIGAGWIDDPSNDNPASLRARTRMELREQDLPIEAQENITPPDLAGLLHDDTCATLGMIVLKADALYRLPPEQALKILSAAAVCAGGGDKLPKRARLEHLYTHLPDGKALTLCGSRLQQQENRITISRETGDIGRQTSAIMELEPGVEAVWDGRFAIVSQHAVRVLPAQGVRAQLDDADRKALQVLPAVLRGSLPVSEKDNQKKLLPHDGKGNVSLTPDTHNQTRVTCLVMRRFYAAMGQITLESHIDSDSWPVVCNGV
jgi:tRNA(Ile)-lysidine synthase